MIKVKKSMVLKDSKNKLEGKLKIPPWLKKSRLINGTLSGKKYLLNIVGIL